MKTVIRCPHCNQWTYEDVPDESQTGTVAANNAPQRSDVGCSVWVAGLDAHGLRAVFDAIKTESERRVAQQSKPTKRKTKAAKRSPATEPNSPTPRS